MRKRNTTIAIRCTEEESRRIHELAKEHGLKLNDFVIRCALGKKIVVANGVTNGEYRVALRGESWKMALSNTIDAVMKRAKSKKQFRFYMKQCGYDVRWEESRKYITYTCPNGRRCRNNKLHEAKYRKENMEYEFEIRRSERSLQAEYAGGTGHTNYGLRPGTQLAGADITAETSDRCDIRCQGSDGRNYDICTDETVPAKSAGDIRSAAGTGKGDTNSNVGNHDFRSIEAGSDSEGARLTGWEAERADLIAAEMLRRAEQKAQLQTAPTGGTDRVSSPDIFGGIAAMASIIEGEPADDTEYVREHIDRKTLAKELRKKEELGMHMG